MGPGRGPIRWLHQLGLKRIKPSESVEWEIEHHLSELTDRLVATGLSAVDARAEAQRQFGDAARYRSHMKRVERERLAMRNGGQIIELLRQTWRGIATSARRYPGHTLAIVLTLALGIGANATMYGIVDRLLLQPPEHIAEPGQVHRVFLSRPNIMRTGMRLGVGFTYPDYEDLKNHGGLTAAAWSGSRERTVGSGEDATRASAVLASSEFFPLLGVTARLGRTYTPDEAVVGAPLTVVISEEYWKRAHASNPDVLGTILEVGGIDREIIGVLPAGFTGIDLQPVDLWLPLENTYAVENGPECLTNRGCWWLRSVVRLNPGVTVESAESEATRLHLNGRQESIGEGGYSDQAAVVLGSLVAARGPSPTAEAQVATWLTGVSAIVLLIACANVANLLLARGTRRRREVAVRLTLGEKRGRLLSQMVLESVGLALVGGAVGLGLAGWGGALVRSTLLPGVLFPDSALNGRVVGFALLISVMAGLIAGASPAIQSARRDVGSELTDASRGSSGSRSRLRGFLTIAQAAMSVILLVGAGLFVRSVTELRSSDLGLDTDRLLMATFELTSPDLDDATQIQLYEDAARRVTGLSAVEAAAATAVPFNWGFAIGLVVPGLDSIPQMPGGGPYYFSVTPAYFETVGLQIRRGRGLDERDGPGGEPVVVVSELMAESLWPGTEALGQCMLIGVEAETCSSVVGVVEDAARGGYRDADYMAYYVPLHHQAQIPRALYVRVQGDVRQAAVDVAAAVRTLSPHVRYANVRTMEDILDPQARSWTLGATMFSVFGGLALLLAAIGLYSVLAFDVTQRTREIGIRTALGASQRKVLSSVLADGARLAGVGIVAGLGTAYFVGPFVAGLLYEVSPRDPLVLVSVAAMLVLVSTLSSVVPGWRATRVSPLDALRAE